MEHRCCLPGSPGPRGRELAGLPGPGEAPGQQMPGQHVHPARQTCGLSSCGSSVKRAAAIGEGSVAVRLACERLQSEGTADPAGLAAR